MKAMERLITERQLHDKLDSDRVLDYIGIGEKVYAKLLVAMPEIKNMPNQFKMGDTEIKVLKFLGRDDIVRFYK